jgi:hypothetical protein
VWKCISDNEDVRAVGSNRCLESLFDMDRTWNMKSCEGCQRSFPSQRIEKYLEKRDGDCDDNMHVRAGRRFIKRVKTMCHRRRIYV